MDNNKSQQYLSAIAEIDALLTGETQFVLKMATIVGVLKQYFEPRFFWVGFYVLHQGELVISAYQGSVACLHIALTRGICGRAARTKQTQIVADTHADAEHIACDSRSNSEIVVPIFDNEGQLIAVLDIDSTEYAAFDTTDQHFLELIAATHFAQAPIVKQYI
jgi:L-methionine (R)-S-oxide reductase